MRSTEGARNTLCAGIVVALLSACAPAPATTDATSFWESLQIYGDEVEGFDSLDQMAASADAVVIGHFVSMELSRYIEGNMAGDLVGLAGITVAVDELLSGAAPNSVLLEFLVPTTRDSLTREGIAAAVVSMAAQLPTERMVLFLRNKAGEESAYHRLVNSLGLWTDAGGVLTAPLHVPVEGVVPYVDDIAGINTIDGLASRIRSR